ncbi:Ig-like domain-containing protein [Clostridium felsineum]|uniref:Ig-like domain-containing protein n=1 Tax=Clostridium felsineum TaxID=36839 RepID=UPI00098C1AB5|nr:Ig-like domain-containing protein [Clostridium felsineum]URZ00521.1 hypothetical protein CLAUR_005090 [Clostridium felsineum]
MKNKFKISVLVFLVVILGCFTSVFADSTSGNHNQKNNVNGYTSKATQLSLDRTSMSLPLGGTDNFGVSTDATYVQLAWTSSDPSVVSVDYSTGKITALKIGRAAITVTLQDGSNLSASCDVQVYGETKISLNKTTDWIDMGGTDNLSATVSPSYLGVIWSSSDPSIAMVDQNGKVTALKEGTVTISANIMQGGNFASCTVNVINTATISLNKTTDLIAVGGEDNLSATVSPVGVGVTWTSSDPSIATVDSNGKILGVKAGQAKITATAADGKTAECSVTVKSEQVKLTVYMGYGVAKEYDLSEDEVNDFINWYNARANNQTTKAYYVFNVLGKKQYLLFDKIQTFDVE